MASPKAHRQNKYRQKMRRRRPLIPSPDDHAPSPTDSVPLPTERAPPPIETASETEMASETDSENPTTCPLLDLPDELKLEILEYLALWELRQAIRAYSQLKEIPAIVHLLHKRQREYDFRLLERGWRYHRLLVWILTKKYSPDTFTELNVGVKWMKREHRTGEGFDEDEQQTRQHKKLIRDEFTASPWFDNRERSAFMLDLLASNGDAAIALVLPRLWNLRAFAPPLDARWTLELMQRISMAQSLSSTSIQDLPLSRVVLLTIDHKVYPAWHESSNDPAFWTAWMATMLESLRSVKRIVITRLHPETFSGWPNAGPRPTCPEIMIERSYNEEHTRMFVAGLRAPCVIRVQGKNDPGECDCQDDRWPYCDHKAAQYYVYKVRFDECTSAMP